MSAVAARRILTVPVPAADAAVPHPAGAGLAILRAGELVVHDWTGERAWAAVVDPHPGDSVRPVLHWSDAIPEIFVATGSGLSVFDPDTGRSLPVPAQLGGRPSGGAIAVSDDGRLLVVGHLDGGCSVLDLRTFQVYPVRVVDPPTGLAFSARNRDLYVSTDRVVQLWDWGRSVLLSSFGEGYRAIRGMALIPGERYLVLAEGRGVHLVRRRDGGPERFAPLPDASAIRRSASGEWILAVGSDDEGRGRVRLFGPDLAEGTDLPVASSPGGLGGGERGLFTCLDGESVQLWALPGSDPEPPPRREDARRWANRMAVTVGRTGPAALPRTTGRDGRCGVPLIRGGPRASPGTGPGRDCSTSSGPASWSVRMTRTPPPPGPSTSRRRPTDGPSSRRRRVPGVTSLRHPHPGPAPPAVRRRRSW